MKIDYHLERSIREYMLSDPESEMCGLVVESGGLNKFIPCNNDHPDNKNNFRISPGDFIKSSLQGRVIAVCHSHTKSGLNHLSSNDRICQYSSSLSWILFCNDGGKGYISVYDPIPKLKGRDFVEGYLDCYDSFKDFYALAGIEMGNYSPDDGYRIPDWYKIDGAESPFLNNIMSEGFFQIKSASELEHGDVILSLLGAKVPNHASIYVGDNHIFHHLPGRLSGCEPMKSFYMKYAHSFWRHSERDKLNIKEVIDLLNGS